MTVERRKEQRPDEILDAALDLFVDNGYEATRLADIAERAGVSKGLLYHYFETKEALFQGVVRKNISSRIDAISESAHATTMPVAAFLKGPFLSFVTGLMTSRTRLVVRLILVNGAQHPELTAYYWHNVVSRGLGLLQGLIDKGIRSGEFRPNALQEFPQLLLAPAVMSVVWEMLFGAYCPLDTKKLLAAHVDFVLDAIAFDKGVRE